MPDGINEKANRTYSRKTTIIRGSNRPSRRSTGVITKGGRDIPPVEEWDYQSAEFGPRGEDLPEGASQWKPDGKPFFGEGLTGKLKEYWWNFTKDVPNAASVAEMAGLHNEAWKQAKETGSGFAWSPAGREFF